MPKLIVYVKADTWRRIEAAANGEDAAALARRVSVEAIEELVAGLSERGEREDRRGYSSALAQPPGQATEPGRSEGLELESSPRSEKPGRCGMSTPAGTKCKVCGKVHPL